MAHRSHRPTLLSFGALIARRRLMANLSTEELAEAVGVSQSLISRIENGHREPRLEIIMMLNNVLNISDSIVNYLKTGEFGK